MGLILQYQYVGLEKLPVCGASVQHNVESSRNGANGNETINNATVEGDECRRQISGAPMASMLCVVC